MPENERTVLVVAEKVDAITFEIEATTEKADKGIDKTIESLKNGSEWHKYREIKTGDGKLREFPEETVDGVFWYQNIRKYGRIKKADFTSHMTTTTPKKSKKEYSRILMNAQKVANLQE